MSDKIKLRLDEINSFIESHWILLALGALAAGAIWAIVRYGGKLPTYD